MAFTDTLSNPQSPNLIRPAVEDNTTAQAITAFGNLGVEAYRGKVDADLESSIEKEIKDFGIARSAEDEMEVAISGTSQQLGQLAEQTAGFLETDPGITETEQTFLKHARKLQSARASGAISTSELETRIEAHLRSAINRLPGRAANLRNLAVSTLGDYKAALEPYRLAEKQQAQLDVARQKQYMKLQEDAVKNGFGSVEQFLQFTGPLNRTRLEMEMSDLNAHQYGAGSTFLLTTEGFAGPINRALEASGGTLDAKQLQAVTQEIRANTTKAIQQLDLTASQKGYSIEQRNKIREQYIAEQDRYLELLNESGNTEVLTKVINEMKARGEHWVATNLPDLYALNQGLGEQGAASVMQFFDRNRSLMMGSLGFDLDGNPISEAEQEKFKRRLDAVSRYDQRVAALINVMQSRDPKLIQEKAGEITNGLINAGQTGLPGDTFSPTAAMSVVQGPLTAVDNDAMSGLMTALLMEGSATPEVYDGFLHPNAVMRMQRNPGVLTKFKNITMSEIASLAREYQIAAQFPEAASGRNRAAGLSRRGAGARTLIEDTQALTNRLATYGPLWGLGDNPEKIMADQLNKLGIDLQSVKALVPNEAEKAQSEDKPLGDRKQSRSPKKVIRGDDGALIMEGTLSPTQELNDMLVKVGKTAKPSELLELIGEKESLGNYNAHYGNARNEAIGFTDMTIDQVLTWQNNFVKEGSPSSAVGKYQFIRKTLADLKAELGLSGTEKFTPELQDRLAMKLLQRRGLDDFIAGNISATQFGNNLAKEWASLPVMSGSKKGKSYYDGDGLNRAFIQPEQVERALPKKLDPGTYYIDGELVEIA